MATYSVTLKKMIKDLSLEPIYLPEDESNLFIRSADVNRPGLHLSGFVEYFEPSRVQITGKMEFAYLESLDPQTRKERIYSLFSKKSRRLLLQEDFRYFRK